MLKFQTNIKKYNVTSQVLNFLPTSYQVESYKV